MKEFKKKNQTAAKEETSKKGVLDEKPQEAKAESQQRTEVFAKARYLRISPKKAKLVIDAVRGMKVNEALEKLHFVNKKATNFVSKLLNSAVANAEHNFNLNKSDLFIKKIIANQGPAIHRFRAAAFGQAHPIKKRTTHLELVLGVSGSANDQPKKNKPTARQSVKETAKANKEEKANKVKAKAEVKKEEII